MPTKRIDFVKVMYHRNWADADTLPAIDTLDQRAVNVIYKAVVNEITRARKIWVCKRPGIDTGSGLSAGVATGAYAALMSNIVGAGGYNTLSLWPSTTAGNVRIARGLTGINNNLAVTGHNGSSRITQFFDGAGTYTWVFHVTCANPASNRRSYFGIDSGVAGDTQISDVDYPNTVVVGNFVYLSGYLFIMTYDLGRIYNSDLNSLTAWTSTSFLTTSFGGGGCGLAPYQDKIVAFSDYGIEFYENIGNAVGSPLQRINHLTTTQYGVARNVDAPGVTDTGHFYYAAMDTVFWINNPDTSGGPGIFMLEGFKPKKISSPEIDFNLSRFLPSVCKIAGIVEIYGYNYLFISTGGQSTSFGFVYCMNTGLWTTWESSLFDANWPAIVNQRGDTAGLQNETLIFAGTKIYKLSIESMLRTDLVFTDNSVAYTTTLQLGDVDFGTKKRKRLNSLRIVGLDPRAASTTGISWSDDDGQTYSTARNVDMNDDDPKLTRCGAFRRRSFRITNAANTSFQAEALECEYDELNS